MKEIKFRQRNGDTWHYWGFIDGGFVAPCRLDTPSDQYTNLKDKNGREIFEDDIVMWYGQRCKVEYRGIAFGIIGLEPYFNGNVEYSYDTITNWEKADDPSIEVIGNIEENPELLPNL
jgi:uncharacterized phage protein (TIGR01671 family)